MNKQRKYHYFYKITNNLNGHFYYGVHNTDDINDGYMGSGKKLHYAYKKYGVENFSKEILKFFDTAKEAFEYEAEIVNEDLIKDDNCYNIQLGGDGWHTLGLVSVKDNKGNTFLTSKDDPRYLAGELVGVTKGTFTTKDINGNYFNITKNDSRYISGELTGITKNTIFVRDKQNNFHRISKDDERLKNGEFTNKGYTNFKDKNGNIIFANVNDEKVLSGELIGVTKDMLPVKDKNGNCFLVLKDDPRYLSGELVSTFKGKHHSEETKQKMREKMTKNSNNPNIWISKEGIHKYIKKEKLNEYLLNGWVIGRIKYNKED